MLSIVYLFGRFVRHPWHYNRIVRAGLQAYITVCITVFEYYYSRHEKLEDLEQLILEIERLKQ